MRRLNNENSLVRAELDYGFPLLALLTKQGIEELSRREGTAVRVRVKAPQIHLIPRSPGHE
ncbi:MAG: hypothetical protein ACYDC1_12250 [Limisphaerales bacterium]